MCGIAGIVRFDDAPIEIGRARAVLAALRHRGPDGEGIDEMPRCTLVHTRLSIIDLLGGRQPMIVPARPHPDGTFNADGRDDRSTANDGELRLIFNGEIYNHRALRKQLENLGHRFESSHCDTEVLLHGYREWGTELPKRLHGMFAFAIWNVTDRSLFLCRDRAGKKPLYVRWSRDRREMMFASLVSALAAGLPAGERPSASTIDREALRTYLRFGYTFEQSLLPGIEEPPAAHWMRIDAQGRVACERYWRPPPISRSSTSLGAVAGARELLEEAVAKRLEADVPLGCFLSGGIDSSLVAAIAHRQLAERGEGALRTFSVAMPDLSYDESAHARAVAEHLGTEHTELVAERPQRVIDDLAALIALMGEPTADSSILPTYWLSRVTRDHVKVVLSGDGGDELFGGYERYRAMRLLTKHRWWLARLPLGVLINGDARTLRGRLGRLVHAARGGGEARQYRRMIQLFDEEQVRELGIGSSSVDSVDESAGGEGTRGADCEDDHEELIGRAREAASGGLPDWPNEPDAAHAAMRWDLVHYLPFDLLRKVDRASMAFGLEVRCPLLDTQVCDLAGHLPTSVLMPGGRPKGLLRQVAAEVGLPASVVNRRKQGFAVPIGQWMRGPLRDTLAEHVMEGELASLGVNRPAVECLLDEHQQSRADHTHRLFGLLMLSMWAGWLKDVGSADQRENRTTEHAASQRGATASVNPDADE